MPVESSPTRARIIATTSRLNSKRQRAQAPETKAAAAEAAPARSSLRSSSPRPRSVDPKQLAEKLGLKRVLGRARVHRLRKNSGSSGFWEGHEFRGCGKTHLVFGERCVRSRYARKQIGRA